MLSRLRLIVPFFALIVLLAGCGGGGGQADNAQGGGSQDGGGEEQKQSKKEARETKIGVGNVVSVKPDKRRMVVMPSREAEDAEKLTLNVRKNAEITLGSEKAEMGDIAKGQQAQVEYVVKNDVNRAISVQLFKAEEQNSGEQPSGEEEPSN
ncbi:hypothetical protein GBA63_17225 [Rubrobacter tropicus]|uniref:DUF5666 domain-containing protein n=1 Tax=Rubrobacter tropicus TaxID=2653851 RepID=A0A6G8QD63_9ACTN|nr:hypothetical protein [Rubrobacter tropicus]QIN84197.1 hypothetical protein GBA63_17225 [Rubrobacter tropicus]